MNDNYYLFKHYLKKYKMKKSTKTRIKNDKLLVDFLVADGKLFVPKRMTKIDLRLIPSKLKQENAVRAILRSINTYRHINHKMLQLEEYHFEALIDTLENELLIKKISDSINDNLVIENYQLTNKGIDIIKHPFMKALSLLKEITININVKFNTFM